MRILIIQPWLRVGGAEMLSLRLADDLQQLGHATKIAALFAETGDLPKGRAEVEYALPPRAIGRICSQNRLFFFLLGPIVLFLVVLVNSAGIDLLNPHNFPSHWIAALVGRLRGIPVLWTCNEPPAPLDTRDAFRVGIPDYLGWTIASCPIDLFAVKHIAHIQVLSLKAQHDVLQRYGRCSTVVRCGVDPNAFKGARAANAVKKYQLQGKYVIACVGKLHPQKNQAACLNSLREVLPLIPNAVLLLVGVGPQRQELEKLSAHLGVADHVLFVGQVPFQELSDIYAASNLNLLPAKNQSWGLTPFEALCVDRISIVSSDSGAAEVIEVEGIGLVCEPSPRGIADRILEVHSAPRKFSQLARRGHAYVERELTPTRFAEQFAELAASVTKADDEASLSSATISEAEMPL